MNKQILTAALMQMAPQVLSALKGAYTTPDERAILANAVQNGADPGLMGDQFDEIAAKRKALTDGWDTPMSDTMNVNDLVKLYDTTAAQGFPSQNVSARDYITDALSRTTDPHEQIDLVRAQNSPGADMQVSDVFGLADRFDDWPDYVPAGIDYSKNYRPSNKYRAAESADVMLDALWNAAAKQR